MGAYVVNRRAAEVLLKKAYPIFLPADHFVARSHLFGLKTAVVEPFPVLLGSIADQTTIDYDLFRKYPRLIRWLTTLPYRGIVETRKNIHQLFEIATVKLFPPKPED
ncbi:MAG: hypothetical protein Q4G59_00040 [Planctomycetia bacterium]|nr:hypothetical protein [Planctomycetia bacterium]